MTANEQSKVVKAANAWAKAIGEHVLSVAFQSPDEPEKNAIRGAAYEAFLDVVYPLSVVKK